jgi:hypothetical protein
MSLSGRNTGSHLRDVRSSCWPAALAATLVCWLIVGSCGALRGARGAPAPDGPRLAVNPEKIDFGKVRLGKRVRASFTIANKGAGLLEFTAAPYIEVKEGCCPPVVFLGAWALKPGERTTVSMQLAMSGNRGGVHDFRLHLPTNDPQQPDRVVTVRSNWVP